MSRRMQVDRDGRDNWVERAETIVLAALKRQPGPVGIEVLCADESLASSEFSATELRIAALNLVSQGRARLAAGTWLLEVAP